MAERHKSNNEKNDTEEIRRKKELFHKAAEAEECFRMTSDRATS